MKFDRTFEHDVARKWQDPARCRRCGERFHASSERAEVVDVTTGEVLIIHEACRLEDDLIA